MVQELFYLFEGEASQNQHSTIVSQRLLKGKEASVCLIGVDSNTKPKKDCHNICMRDTFSHRIGGDKSYKHSLEWEVKKKKKNGYSIY